MSASASMSLSNLGRMFRRANANKGRIVRALGETGRSGFWAMADQGVASVGNFAINILLARAFAMRGVIEEYGVFGFLFELMFFINGVQGALIIYPLTVRGAQLDRRGIGRLASACMLLTFLAVPFTGGAVGIAAGILSHRWTVGLWAAVALMTWQMQETTRRGLMATLRFRDAIWGDAISYGGQALAVLVLAQYERLTLETAFQAMALTSALAALVQSMQLRLAPAAIAEVIDFAKTGWLLGRWVLVGNVSALVTGTMFTANFMYWAGKEVLGIAFAINNLFRLVNPLMFSITSLIMPHAARALRSEGGMRAARNVFLRFTGLGLLMLAPYLGALILFPRLSIRLVGSSDPEFMRYAWLVIVIAFGQFIFYLNQASGAFLGGVEHSRFAMIGQITYSATFAIIGMPITALWGFPGAVMAGVLAAAVQFVLNVANIRRVTASPARAFGVAAAPAIALPPVESTTMTPGSTATSTPAAPQRAG